MRNNTRCWDIQEMLGRTELYIIIQYQQFTTVELFATCDIKKMSCSAACVPDLLQNKNNKAVQAHVATTL